MPFLRIETNLPKEKIPPNFLKEMTVVFAKTLGKPESYTAVGVQPGMMLIFAGTDEPCAQITVTSIGCLGMAENKTHSKAISDKIFSDLGISPSRMYIVFNDVPSSQVGFKGTTFHELMG